MVTVETRATGRRRPLVPQWGFALPGGWSAGRDPTLREVIERIVREEVAAFRERQAGASSLRVLTEREIVDGEAHGRITSGGTNLRQPVDPDGAIAAALTAFVDGLYLVIIDGAQYEALEDSVRLGADSEIVLLRLVALAGG